VSWTPEDVPDLSGKTFVITGANSGIGFQAARLLARSGGAVILGCRSAERAMPAVTLIANEFPNADVSFLALDLADLGSVARFAETVKQRCAHLDVLINNAGVMAIPRAETAQGFEMQLGTNHLGHFALTAHLIPHLRAAPEPRVVHVSSHAHRDGVIQFDDLQSTTHYNRWKAYCQSKLANLLFHYELSRRSDLLSAACHPGYAATNLQSSHARMTGSVAGRAFWSVVNRWVAQDSEPGSHPTVYAATMPEVQGGDYYGPGGLFEMWGPPKKVSPAACALDATLASRLWDTSVTLTGVDPLA
jgi:NAD(P)-dependent dehydrogenase (short-subunit alcohol dehydrogenase family)